MSRIGGGLRTTDLLLQGSGFSAIVLESLVDDVIATRRDEHAPRAKKRGMNEYTMPDTRTHIE
jgi:hypothetical protein